VVKYIASANKRITGMLRIQLVNTKGALIEIVGHILESLRDRRIFIFTEFFVMESSDKILLIIQ
jgi:hypothetical protein